MSLATLDTHEVVKDLLTAGFTDEQATAVARNLRKAQDLDISSLATKTDLLVTKTELKDEIDKVRGDVDKVRGDVDKVRGDVEKLRGDVEKVRGDVEKVRGDVEKLRTEVGKDIADAKVDILKWMVGTMGFQTLIILGAVVTLIKLVKP